MLSMYARLVLKQMQRTRLSLAAKAICYSKIFGKISQDDMWKCLGELPANNLTD